MPNSKKTQPKITLPKKRANGGTIKLKMGSSPTKTAKVNRIESNELGQDTILLINGVTSSTCTVFKCSPLNTSSDPDELSILEKELQFTLMEKLNNKFIEPTKEQLVLSIKQLNEVENTTFDSDSLLIEAFKENVAGNKKKIFKKRFFKLLFTSCGSQGASTRHLHQLSPRTIQNLPILIWNGKDDLWELVHPVIERQFACNFSAVHFSPIHLRLFAGILLAQENKRTEETPLNNIPKIVYVDQQSKEVTTYIELSKWTKDLIELANGPEKTFHKAASKLKIMDIWDTEMKTLLKKHKEDISRCPWTQVATNFSVISSEGRLKFRDDLHLDEFKALAIEMTRIIECR